MSNTSAREIFEELYTIKNSLKAFVESKVVAEHHRLEWATLREPQFATLKRMFAEDASMIERELSEIDMPELDDMIEQKDLD